MTSAVPSPEGAAQLVLQAAARLHGNGEAPEGGHAWRDAAVVAAVREAARAGDGAAVEALAAGYGGFLQQVPVVRDGRVALVEAGSGERRRRGAFATPAPLAAVLARHALPAAGNDRPAGQPARSIPAAVPTVVDPACGTGPLLRAAFARLVSLGAAPPAALAALHGVDEDPAAVAVCRAALAVDARRAGVGDPEPLLAERVVVADALLGATPAAPDGTRPALHELFPAVLAREGAPPEPVTGWRGGFDAVLANPPWERLKVAVRDWAGAHPPAGASLDGLRRSRADTARTVRTAGRHPLTGAGEVNAYLPFVETCWRLLAPHGRAALVVPAGVASDRSAAALLRALLDGGALAALHLLSPSRALFEAVSRRVGVAVVVLRHGPQVVTGDPAEVVVGSDGAAGSSGSSGSDGSDGSDGSERGDVARAWSLDAATLRLVNPNTGTAPLFASRRDAQVAAAVHRRWPVLRRRDDRGEVVDDPWQVRMWTSLHMTRDARWFRPGPGPGLVPLWEAKHAGLLDHRGGGRRGARYWVPASLVEDRFGELTARGWLAGFRNVATADGPRTLLPTALPVVGVGNSLPLVSAPRLPLLLAALAALPVDHLVRVRHAGANLNFFKLEQVPLPPPERYDEPAPWQPGTTTAAWVLERFAAAVAWHGELDALAAELGALGVAVDPCPDPARRRRALAELDAAHAVLLGLDREDLRHVLSTFTALRRREEAATGTFVTGRDVLAAFDVLTGTTD